MQSFAVVPAAGQSWRLGRAKLLLPWRDGRTILETVLSRWMEAKLTAVVVVTPSPQWNAELAQAVAATCRASGAIPIQPDEQPREMKDSVLLAVQHIDRCYNPSDNDVWLLAPADMPSWPSAVVERLLQAATDERVQIAVPTYRSRRGHPVLFRWKLKRLLEQLGPSEGVNALVHRVGCTELPWGDETILTDLDTLQDYHYWRCAVPAPSDANRQHRQEDRRPGDSNR